MNKKQILDELGFVRENQYLVVYFPQWEGLLGYRIRARVNKGFEVINYGPLPIPDGIAKGNTNTGVFKLRWDILPIERREDMFWYDIPSKLLHVYLDFHPFILRNYLYLTEGIQQARYLGLVTADSKTGSDFGYWRGEIELVILPFMHIAFDCFNKTNMNLYTYLRIKYGEYLIELITEPKELFGLMTRKIPAHWVSYPGQVPFPVDPFQRAYGISKPFPLRKTLEEVIADIEALNP